MKADFTLNLLSWNKKSNTRKMPWKGEKDPYKIWLSEIILQQTRVEQGLAYYNRFVAAYPTISDLANAPDEKVYKLWEGLGYYSRCKNLLITSRFVAFELEGKFPDTFKNIIALKGIGNYTASAIASFAFNQPYAVLDGNVFRVLSRYFGINTPVDTNDGKKLYTLLATKLLDVKQAGVYNQAIMDFGAVVCKPQQPHCITCPQKKECVAFKQNWVNELPVKEKKLSKKTRYFNYLVINTPLGFIIKKRTGKDIWQNLHEFVLCPSLTNNTGTFKTELLDELASLFPLNKMEILSFSKQYQQQLTHQTIISRFLHVKTNDVIAPEKEFFVAPKNKLYELAFPKTIVAYLQEYLMK
jgi:A/G-specific adenine glycosylase